MGTPWGAGQSAAGCAASGLTGLEVEICLCMLGSDLSAWPCVLQCRVFPGPCL